MVGAHAWGSAELERVAVYILRMKGREELKGVSRVNVGA